MYKGLPFGQRIPSLKYKMKGVQESPSYYLEAVPLGNRASASVMKMFWAQL